MGQAERDIINERLAGLAPNERLFRANCGMGWAGKATRKGRFTVIQDARVLHAMPEGFPDLVGFTVIEITPEMVGKKIAVFTAEEVKAGKSSIKKGSLQDKFRDLFIGMGAIYRVLK